jgi:hypothetical protein
MTRSGIVGGSLLGLAIGAAVWAGLAAARSSSLAQDAPQAAYTAPVQVDTASLAGPRQPVFFRHDVHAGEYEIPCLYCHSTAAEAPKPGIPSMQTCMGCHLVVRGADSTNQAEIAKLTDAWGEERVIEWVRVHGVPQYAHFPHMRHVNALAEEAAERGDVACTTCHGDVREMAQVYQFSSLKMGWCVDCHVEREVSRDCTGCHY